jgi:catechol 2,3-dioxygenase-like lactoylglutathione lyase family enzyme
MRTIRFRNLAVAAALVLGGVPSASAQPATIGSAPLARVGVVVRDVKASVQKYVDVFQLPAAPAISTVNVDLPKGSVKVRRAVVQLPNVRIEIDQPQGGSGPAAAYLKQYGQGIYRLGYSVPEAIGARVAALEQKGGRVVAGRAAGTFAWVDMTHSLGTVIDLMQDVTPVAAAAPTPSIMGDKAVLATTAMSHLGFGVPNADETAKAFADVFGIPAPTVRDFKPVDIPPGYDADPAATLRLTSWKQANTGMELIQSIGQTNWTDFVGKHGKQAAPQHLAFPVGDKLAQTTRLFQSKGAAWTNGKIGGTYVYLDFTETLGIIFELNGAWKE